MNPLDITGLRWWRADDDTYQDAARATPAEADDPVGGWADQSANANHGSQSTDNRRPILRAAQKNGLPALEFTQGGSATDYLQFGNIALESFTLLMVMKPDFVNDFNRFVGKSDSSTGSWILDIRNNGKLLFYRHSSDFPATADGTIGTNYVVVSMIVNGTAVNVWVDGVNKLSTTISAGIINAAAAPFTVGICFTTYPDLGFDGFIGDVMLVPSAISTEDRVALERFLLDRWGIQYYLTAEAGSFAITGNDLAQQGQPRHLRDFGIPTSGRGRMGAGWN